MGEFYDPENAAKCIAARFETLKAVRSYITEVFAKYEGMKAFERALEAEGITLEAIKAETAQ